MSKISFLKEHGVEVEKSLELLGDIETYNEILADFYDELMAKLEELEGYYGQKDLENYAILVHGMKSEARYLGFEQLAALLYEHEVAGKENNFSFIEDNYENLKTELKKAYNLIAEYQK